MVNTNGSVAAIIAHAINYWINESYEMTDFITVGSLSSLYEFYGTDFLSQFLLTTNNNKMNFENFG